MVPYLINPVRMHGTVKPSDAGFIRVDLAGRLGVLTLSRRLLLPGCPTAPGAELSLYFSYLETDPSPREYDMTELLAQRKQLPVPVGGTLTEVNDTAVRCTLPAGLGTVAVPRRWVFTGLPLAEGQTAGFYLSPLAPLPADSAEIHAL